MSNSGIVNIRGKEYQTVALRVQKFREAHPDWEISTEIIEANEKLVIMQARIYNTECRCIATGHAEEFRAASQINSTSALENAETSAIGRALAAAGWGGTEFASANEVQNAIHQQNKKVDSTNFVEQIRGAKNVEELKTHFATAFAATKQDPIAVAAITAAKDARKAELAA
jgi:aminopeptidase N